jgi:hypothetical protein
LTVTTTLALAGFAGVVVRLAPGDQLKLDEPVAQEMADGKINTFYSSNSLFWKGSHLVTVSVGCGTAGSTTLTFEPAKSSVGLSHGSLDAAANGYVLVRIHNIGACVPTGLFSPVGPNEFGIVVAAPRSGAPGNYDAFIAAQGASGPKQIAFQFCGHNNGPQSDEVKVTKFDPHTEPPCAVTARLSAKKRATGRKGDDSSEPELDVAQPDGGSDLLWIACSRDCCPASAPPDSSGGRGRGRRGRARELSSLLHPTEIQ